MKRYSIANLSDRHFYGNRYLFSFGAYGWTRVLVFASDVDSALEEAFVWCEKNAPGLFCDETVQEEYNRGLAEGLDEEKAQEQAEIDTVRAESHYMNSWEVSVDENPPLSWLRTVGRN